MLLVILGLLLPEGQQKPPAGGKKSFEAFMPQQKGCTAAAVFVDIGGSSRRPACSAPTLRK